MKGLICVLFAVLTLTISKIGIAQDPVEVAPDQNKILFENERVRVIEVTIPVGAKEPMHSHPIHVVYAFHPAKVRFTLPDGQVKEVEIAQGQVLYNEPVTHAVENVGSTGIHVLNFELKQ